ncbi:MAG: GAF domain-containing protein [Acidobacteriota bacterium]
MESAATKSDRYRAAQQELAAVLRDIEDPIAVMATAACILHRHIPQASWTGFYRVVAPDLLRIGPYQGPVGCLEIAFDRGVCGAAAREGRTQRVEDVHAFPGHIACDAETRSEIVLPVHSREGKLIAVLDIDSHQPAAFDEEDQAGLERIVAALERRLP